MKKNTLIIWLLLLAVIGGIAGYIFWDDYQRKQKIQAGKESIQRDLKQYVDETRTFQDSIYEAHPELEPESHKKNDTLIIIHKRGK